jgi:hypothetical protein
MTKVEKWIEAWVKVPQGTLYLDDVPYLNTVEAELRPRNQPLCANAVNPVRNGQFHFQLGSMPFVGNLRKAQIFFLMINPGVNEDDYQDLRSGDTQQLFERNRQQELDYCFALRGNEVPENAWIPYFRGPARRGSVFGALIRELRQEGDETLIDLLETKLAILELVPYYSQNSDLITRLQIVDGRDVDKRKSDGASPLRQGGLPSAQLALDAVAEIAKDEQNLIVTRWPTGARRWHLKTNGNLNKDVLVKVVESHPRQGLCNEAKVAIKTKLREIASERSL